MAALFVIVRSCPAPVTAAPKLIALPVKVVFAPKVAFPVYVCIPVVVIPVVSIAVVPLTVTLAGAVPPPTTPTKLTEFTPVVRFKAWAPSTVEPKLTLFAPFDPVSVIVPRFLPAARSAGPVKDTPAPAVFTIKVPPRASWPSSSPCSSAPRSSSPPTCSLSRSRSP